MNSELAVGKWEFKIPNGQFPIRFVSGRERGDTVQDVALKSVSVDGVRGEEAAWGIARRGDVQRTPCGSSHDPSDTRQSSRLISVRLRMRLLPEKLDNSRHEPQLWTCPVRLPVGSGALLDAQLPRNLSLIEPELKPPLFDVTAPRSGVLWEIGRCSRFELEMTERQRMGAHTATTRA